MHLFCRVVRLERLMPTGHGAENAKGLFKEREKQEYDDEKHYCDYEDD